jgi:hypothetical protein
MENSSIGATWKVSENKNGETIFQKFRPFGMIKNFKIRPIKWTPKPEVTHSAMTHLNSLSA